jgi:hypothetical protein
MMNYPVAIHKIIKLIRQNKIDLVHSNTVHNLYGFLAAKLSGRRHVWHVREIVFQSRFLWFLEQFFLKYFSHRIIEISNKIALKGFRTEWIFEHFIRTEITKPF